ncbi:MAG TPA: hypothetical protein VEL06_07675 [Haliangiales bacterium]|nr:hypothetical protein [Haliangiales bacterium]
MNKLNPVLALAGIAALLALGTGNLAAQQRPGGGNFDPAQFRQRMLDNTRERLEVKSDDEWKIIQPRVEKVIDARRDVGFGGGMGMFARGGGRRGGDGGNAAQGTGDNQGGRRGLRGGEANPEAEELQKAIDSNASSDEIKAKLAKLREARKEKEAKLASAQEELKKVLSVKQEAAAVLMGLLQ